MEFATCRYNPNHKNIKKSRLMMHEFKCPDKNNSLKCCIYNPSHKFLITEIESHQINCPDKPKTIKHENSNSEDLELDIRAYIQNNKENDHEDKKQSNSPLQVTRIITNKNLDDKKMNTKEILKLFKEDELDDNNDDNTLQPKIDETHSITSNINTFNSWGDPEKEEVRPIEFNIDEFADLKIHEIDEEYKEYKEYSEKNMIPIDKNNNTNFNPQKNNKNMMKFFLDSYWNISTENDKFIKNNEEFSK